MKLLTAEQSMEMCVRCGRCRDVCPTLDITGREADGPRGRVLMARSLLRGEIAVDEEIEHQLNRCMLCSACEDVCPVGVQVPEIVMAGKRKIQAEKQERGQERLWEKRLRNLVFERILPHQKRLQFVGHLLWLYQKSGLQWLTRKLGILKLFPESMRQMEAVLPDIPSPSERRPLPKFVQNKQGTTHGNETGAKTGRKRVAMFRGCIMDVMFRKTNLNSIHLLAESGFDVVTPDEQVCCGALHNHNGKRETTIELAKKNIEVFEQLDVDYIVSNAGGCGAMLKEYAELFRDDPEWLERAKTFCSKVRDISELIVQEGQLPAASGRGERVTYQPSCHLQYVMKVKDAPQKILQQVDQIEFVPLPESKLCCGSAGIYNLLQPEMANDVLDKKMTNVRKTQSDVIITANPGCLLQMKAGLYREGLTEQVQAMHIVDFLTESKSPATDHSADAKTSSSA